MNDSANPVYQKGFRAGRKLTDLDLEAYKAAQPSKDQWNQIYLNLLPIAFTQCSTWTIKDKKCSNPKLIAELAAGWADEAFTRLK